MKKLLLFVVAVAFSATVANAQATNQAPAKNEPAKTTVTKEKSDAPATSTSTKSCCKGGTANKSCAGGSTTSCHQAHSEAVPASDKAAADKVSPNANASEAAAPTQADAPVVPADGSVAPKK